MKTVEGWATYKISDICSVGRGRVISAKEIQNNLGIYPVYSSQSANNGEMGKIETFDFDGEYVTWTTDGAYAGTVFYRRGKFNCTNVCGTLASKNDNLSMPFLAYKLSTVAKNYVSYIGNPKLMNNVMAGIEILLPNSKPEQTKIAEILSCIDTAIEQTEAMIAKQQRIKTGLMQDLLSKGIDEHGNIRTEQTHAFKDSELGRIPVEWEVVALENVTSHIVDCPHTTPFFIADGVLVARTFNIKDGSFVDGNVFYVSEAEFKERNSRLEPQAGDIIFTREAPVGEAFLIPDGMRICLGQRTMLIRCNKQKCVPDYLIETLYSQKMRVRFDQMVGGTTNPHLNVADVRKLLIALPNAQEQKKISEILTINRKALHDAQSQKYKFEKTKTALMQDLLSGNVRVNGLI